MVHTKLTWSGQKGGPRSAAEYRLWRDPTQVRRVWVEQGEVFWTTHTHVHILNSDNWMYNGDWWMRTLTNIGLHLHPFFWYFYFRELGNLLWGKTFWLINARFPQKMKSTCKMWLGTLESCRCRHDVECYQWKNGYAPLHR